MPLNSKIAEKRLPVKVMLTISKSCDETLGSSPAHASGWLVGSVGVTRRYLSQRIHN